MLGNSRVAVDAQGGLSSMSGNDDYDDFYCRVEIPISFE
jgi:hypothetical protein